MKYLLKSTMFVLLFWGCKATKTKQKQISKEVLVYERGVLHIEGLSFGKANETSIQAKYENESDAPSIHSNSIRFLEEFLSVNNPKWYQKMFFEGKVFLPIDTEVFAKRNLGQKESYEILKLFGITYDNVSYKVLKIKHITFIGEEKIIKMLLRYDKNKERYYLIEKVNNSELSRIIDVFYRMKREIGYELTKIHLVYNFPPAENKVIDKMVKDAINYRFGVGHEFNVSRFVSTIGQWETEGKEGLLNYFFEN